MRIAFGDSGGIQVPHSAVPGKRLEADATGQMLEVGTDAELPLVPSVYCSRLLAGGHPSLLQLGVGERFVKEYGGELAGSSSMSGPIADDALVIRGGRNQPVDLERGTGIHPSGTTGVSVECARGLSVGELAAFIPHGQIGVTTVSAVRALGGDVVRTSGRSPHHATLTGLTPEDMSRLLTPTIRNPARGD